MNILTKLEKASKKLTLIKELDELILKHEKLIENILNKRLEIKINLSVFDPLEKDKIEAKKKADELIQDPIEKIMWSYLPFSASKKEDIEEPILQMFLKDQEAVFMINFHINSLKLEREKIVKNIENIMKS